MPTKIVHVKRAFIKTVDFVYDGEGNRVKKSLSGGTTNLYIVPHYEKVGSTTVRYIFAWNLRIARVTDSIISYYHKDHLTSSVATIDYGSGSTWTGDYMPFGQLREQMGTDRSNYKYTDQELDPETNLYNYKARHYDPIIGRFISPDSLVPQVYDPQMLNRFVYYVRNNLLRLIDPTGMIVEGAYGEDGWGSWADTYPGYNANSNSNDDYYNPENWKGYVPYEPGLLNLVYPDPLIADKTAKTFLNQASTYPPNGMGHEFGWAIAISNVLGKTESVIATISVGTSNVVGIDYYTMPEGYSMFSWGHTHGSEVGWDSNFFSKGDFITYVNICNYYGREIGMSLVTPNGSSIYFEGFYGIIQLNSVLNSKTQGSNLPDWLGQIP